MRFEVRIFDEELVALLRRDATVRFVEPMSYTMQEVNQRSDAGCSNAPAASYIPTADYVTTAPSAKIPWNFYHMNIPTAWSTSTGSGVTICLIDTGTSASQAKLNGSFASGYSTGRFINREGTYDSSWWPWWAGADGPNDDCGHGTQMAGLLAGPRAYGGSTTGVAYGANLLAIRGTGDVVINGWKEKRGVRDALKRAGDRSDVKVVSMSIGDVFYNSTVADGIYYAYNKGKMLLSAAGTSTEFTNWYGVIFPATMAETIAVTGVKDGSYLERCNTCHSGSQVDFIVVMQRAYDDDRTSLTLSWSNDTPSYVSGSSAATATTAGIAALIWATNPSQTRSQVLSRMKNAASIYPARNSQFGWGMIDAAYAVTH